MYVLFNLTEDNILVNLLEINVDSGRRILSCTRWSGLWSWHEKYSMMWHPSGIIQGWRQQTDYLKWWIWNAQLIVIIYYAGTCWEAKAMGIDGDWLAYPGNHSSFYWWWAYLSIWWNIYLHIYLILLYDTTDIGLELISHWFTAIPINKQLYSFSYVCFTAGAAGIVFSAFYVLVCNISVGQRTLWAKIENAWIDLISSSHSFPQMNRLIFGDCGLHSYSWNG